MERKRCLLFVGAAAVVSPALFPRRRCAEPLFLGGGEPRGVQFAAKFNFQEEETDRFKSRLARS